MALSSFYCRLEEAEREYEGHPTTGVTGKFRLVIRNLNFQPGWFRIIGWVQTVVASGAPTEL